MTVIAFPPERPIDPEYVRYIQRRLRAGLISERGAVTALRARDPEITADRVRELLGRSRGSR